MVIVGLMIGKRVSSGVPGKNISYVLGKRLCEYPLIAAREYGKLDHIFVSTDCLVIEEMGLKYDCEIINRPEELEDPETLTEDVLNHAHYEIKRRYPDLDIDYYLLLYANGGFINSKLISGAVNKLQLNPEFDSCVGVCKANMFTPIRAKRIDSGELLPFTDLSFFGEFTSNRDSAGDVYFIDVSLQVIKSYCFEHMDGKHEPFLWLGDNILPYEKDFGLSLIHI